MDKPGVPRYQQIASELISEIESGTYSIGSLMPTEFQLCERFGVSRYTVREAMRRLFEAGLVSRRRGAGTVVLTTERPPAFNQSLKSVSDVLQYARDTRFDINNVSRIRADADLAPMLDGTIGKEWILAKGIRYGFNDPRPVCVSRIYVNDVLHGIEDQLRMPLRSVSELIENKHGIKIIRIEQTVMGLSLTDEDAKGLRVLPGSAGLRAIRKFRDEHNRVIQVTDNIHPADRFKLSMVFDRDSASQL